ncbi:Abi family protein [uncultured Thomasclavelia sp.]|uniref:Abi family protein n=1 Tax=uncultured Thomasclavelia sp. TaxID=3025759 RepID=UPI0026171C78|nr:Abi family protein [uncultured Thomasclavelia sp.]
MDIATKEITINNPDKPFKDYDELINILRKRNIIISDENFAKQCLSDISYYTLINGYKEIFTSNNDVFNPPVIFEDIYLLYMFENTLSSILLKYIIHIEKSLKSKLSYIISKKYGVFTDIYDVTNTNKKDYLYRDNFQNNKYRNNTLRNIKECIPGNKNQSIQYYIANHNHLPCWILINGIYFGQAILLYKSLKSEDKKIVCDQLINCCALTLEEKTSFLSSALDILREYRNSIAHGQKLFNRVISSYISRKIAIQISNTLVTKSAYKKGFCKNDLFAVIMIIFTLTRGLQRKNFAQELISFLESIKDYSFGNKTVFEVFGLPNNFIEILENKITN